MKKTGTAALLLILALQFSQAQDKVNWYSIEEAVALSMKEPRIMLVDVYTDWCGWCKRMDASTFADKEVVRILNSKFYPVKLNAEGREDIVIGENTYKFVDNGRRGYHEIAAIITKGRLAYPTISYLGEGGKILQVAPGYKDVDALMVYLSYYAEEHYKKQSFEEFQASLVPDPPPVPPM